MPGGLETTPSDPLTGLPLAILTTGSDFYIRGGDGERYFHHRNHPGNAPELGNDLSGVALPLDTFESLEGLALRHSSGQDLPDWLHQWYHEIFWGPLLPKASSSKHAAVVLGLANVIPRQAIHIFEKGSYRLVDLSDSQHEFIRRRVHFEGADKVQFYSRRGRIGRYLASYALGNFLPKIVDDREIGLKVEEYLDLNSRVGQLNELVRLRDRDDAEGNAALLYERREEKNHLFDTGDYLVRMALMASVEEVRPILKEASCAGMLQGTRRDIGQVAMKFFGSTRHRDFFPELGHYIELATNNSGQTGVDEVELQAA